ncbi:MAG: type II secretion system F family protein [Candidatus Buchananbacteria bacterium]
MSIFEYWARDKKANRVKGLVDAVSEEAVANLLVERKFTIVNIEKKEPGILSDSLEFLRGRVKTKDLVIFFRQIAVMVDSNMPIVKALRILVRQTVNKKLKMTIAGLADEVEGGNSLSMAMEAFPSIFTPFYINIVKSGETSGRLSEVMSYLADQKEKDYDLESGLKGEMIYPIFIVGALVIVGFVLMTFVMPKMTGMLIGSGAKLPFATRVLMGASGFLNHYWFIVVPLFLLLILIAASYSRTKRGKRLLDVLQINIPIFGKMFRYIYIVRICRSLSTLLKGGVPISAGLTVVRDVVNNSVYYDIISNTIREVSEGNSISGALVISKYMPLIVPQMISVGEEIGKVEDILDKLAEFYSREINNQVKNMSKMVEPVIMIILGLGVAFFIAAIILPIWQLSSMQ